MTQTVALFLDAYRELNARKLFWITMLVSGLVVAVFAFVGINEQGLRIAVWDVPFQLTTSVVSPATFYKLMFVEFGIGFWLTWIAAVLALVSTASMIPDFISGGAIDMVLAKPIGRLRLFLSKYLAGLMFVALQVTVFSTASFLVIGLRGGAWEPGLFLAIPLVVLFFSYLYCVCVLAGLLTRSAIAALILTLLFWLLVFAIHATEASLLFVRYTHEQSIRTMNYSIEHDRDIVRAMEEGGESTPESIRQFEMRIADGEQQLAVVTHRLSRLDVAHNVAMGVKTVLPKTSETVNLLKRWLIDAADLSLDGPEGDAQAQAMQDSDAAQRVEDQMNERSVGWIIGTSLLFEFCVLGLACWLFVRRDF